MIKGDTWRFDYGIQATSSGQDVLVVAFGALGRLTSSGALYLGFRV